jgi:hypothetical protein
VRVLLLGAIALAGGSGVASAAEAPSVSAGSLSSRAETVWASTRPLLLQIRTIVEAAGRQYVIGSGFLVSADGLAITNYHVVSQYALEPQTYRLEYALADGSKGKLELVAIDVGNDVAVVRLDRKGAGYLRFDQRAKTGGPQRGERLFSMGNPLDLGFTIVEGTYNGPVERVYNERLHFSGALNPGMSGGPTVTADGAVVGINVSRELSGELVSFLVPARFAEALLARAQAQTAPPKDFVAEIGRQFMEWQAGLYKSLEQAGFRSVALGGYQVPESTANWFSCWGRTNAGQVPKPRAVMDINACNSDTQLFVANDLNTGYIRLTHAYVKSESLNQFQFSAYLSQQIQPGFGGRSRKWQTQQRCHEDFMEVSDGGARPPLRTVWCARAYRAFPGLYDTTLTAVTQDSGTEALVSQLSMQGVVYDTAVAFGRHFLEGLRWTK